MLPGRYFLSSESLRACDVANEVRGRAFRLGASFRSISSFTLLAVEDDIRLNSITLLVVEDGPCLLSFTAFSGSG